MEHVIRAVRADEWSKVRELRLRAVRDPVADIAFLESHEQLVGKPNTFWQERASNRGGSARQFIAEAPDGTWAGGVTAFVEEVGSIDFMKLTIEQRQTHLVGVYVAPEHRGAGLLGRLFGAALDWSWSLTDPRIELVRLYVHERNLRAQAAYRKLGFAPTGVTVAFATNPAEREFEMAALRPGALS